MAVALSVNEHSGHTKTLCHFADGRFAVQLVSNMERVSTPRFTLRNGVGAVVAQFDLRMEMPQFADRLALLMVSCDLSRDWPAGLQAFVAREYSPANDLSVTPSQPTVWLRGQTIDFARDAGVCRVMGAGGGPAKTAAATADLDADLGLIWFEIGAALDLTEAATRARFRPDALGSVGQGPTGAQPVVCLKGTLADWSDRSGLNLGSGRKFVPEVGPGSSLLAARTPDPPMAVGVPTGLRSSDDPPKRGYVRLFADDFVRRPVGEGSLRHANGDLNEGGMPWLQHLHYKPYHINAGTGERSVFVECGGLGTIFRNGDDIIELDAEHYRPHMFSAHEATGILTLWGGEVKKEDLGIIGHDYWGGMISSGKGGKIAPEECWIEYAYRLPEPPWGYTREGLFSACWTLGHTNPSPYAEIDLAEEVGRLKSFFPAGIWKDRSNKQRLIHDLSRRNLVGPWHKVGVDSTASSCTMWFDEIAITSSDRAFVEAARLPKFLIANMSSGNGRAYVDGQLPKPGKSWFNNIVTERTHRPSWCMQLDYVDVWVPRR